MTSKTVTLGDGFDWHGQHIAALSLRPVPGGLYLELGEPRIVVRTQEGSGYLVEQTSVIKAYLDKLVEHEAGALALSLLTLADAKRLKGALFGFFSDADEAISKSS